MTQLSEDLEILNGSEVIRIGGTVSYTFVLKKDIPDLVQHLMQEPSWEGYSAFSESGAILTGKFPISRLREVLEAYEAYLLEIQ